MSYAFMRHAHSLMFSFALSGVIATVALQAATQGAQPPEGFTSLFNGKSFEGWHGRTTVDPRYPESSTSIVMALVIPTWAGLSGLADPPGLKPRPTLGTPGLKPRPTVGRSVSRPSRITARLGAG